MQLEAAGLDWRVIDDAVMGGCSKGRIRLTDRRLLFSGSLSTENEGGFSSIRSPLPRPVTGLARVRLRLRGDGRRYQFRLRDRDDSAAPAWRAYFDTHGRKQTVELGYTDFAAVVRGRRVEALPGLRDRAICFVGVMLASTRPGPFELELESIELLAAGANDA